MMRTHEQRKKTHFLWSSTGCTTPCPRWALSRTSSIFISFCFAGDVKVDFPVPEVCHDRIDPFVGDFGADVDAVPPRVV